MTYYPTHHAKDALDFDFTFDGLEYNCQCDIDITDEDSDGVTPGSRDVEVGPIHVLRVLMESGDWQDADRCLPGLLEAAREEAEERGADSTAEPDEREYDE